MIFNLWIVSAVFLLVIFVMAIGMAALFQRINLLKNSIKNQLFYVYSLYPARKIKYMNAYSEELLGYPRYAFYKNNKLMDSLINVNDWPVFEFMLKYPEISVNPLIMRMVKNDGSVIWTLHRYTPIRNSAGTVTSVVGIIMDITEEKQQEFSLREGEEKFKELFNHANDLLFLLKHNQQNDRYEIFDLNKTALKTISYDRFSIVNSDICKYLKSDFVTDFKSYMTKTIETGNVSFEMLLDSLHGDEILLDINTSFFRLNNERVILLIGRDITEKRKIENEMERSQRLESLGMLSGGIAHDFNNFLTAILGNISLMRIQLPEDHPMVQNIKDTEAVVYKSKELTRQLLSCSKGFTLIKSVGDIGKIIKETSLFVSRGTGIKCTIDIELEHFYAEFDEGQIVQVVNNIVINAFQAMQGTGTLDVTGSTVILRENNSCKLNPGRYNVFSFKDNGRGIFPEELQKIFDPFFTTKPNGTGLGLTSSFSIMRKHNGTITVDSKIGHGACFNVYIPYIPIETGTVPVKDSKVYSAEKLLKGEGSILLMDDNDDIRTVSKSMISLLGYSIDLAPDGETALQMYQEKLSGGTPYDLVILDLTIQGGMGGKDTMKYLREMDPAVKAIVSSGYSNDDTMAEYKNYGFSGFIVKPYRVDLLSKILHETIKK